MSTLVSNQKWVFGAAGLVLLFGLSAGFFLYRRAAAARRRRAGRYSALPGNEDLALGTLPRGGRGGGPRTKELYDAFGEQGEDDDDDEPDENTALRAASPSRTGAAVGFHEGFLDDDDANTPQTAPTAYRDEPERMEPPSRGSAASPSGSGSGSGDGSWEHASETR
jgi:kexin